MLYQTCRDFADTVLAPNAAAVDKHHAFPTQAVCVVYGVYIVYCIGLESNQYHKRYCSITSQNPANIHTFTHSLTHSLTDSLTD